MGRNSPMSDLALWFKKMRQKTSVKAISDIRIIGMAKYQSSVRNLRNGDVDMGFFLD
jgi:hypothetical protein